MKVAAEQVINAIRESRGNVYRAARRIGCARQTLYSFLRAHPTCQAALDQARETIIDDVDSVLYSKALDGEAWAVCFFLKTHAKHRGYVERTETRITGHGGGPIVVQPYDYYQAITAITAQASENDLQPTRPEVAW